MRPVAARLQSWHALRGVALQMFVVDRAADAELRAQLRDRETVRLREQDKANNLFHGGDLVPGHTLKVSPITPVQVLYHLLITFRLYNVMRVGLTDGMARILRKLGEQTVTELTAAWARPQPEWARRRLLVLRLIAQHELSAAQIAEAVGISRATVFNYLDTAETRGVAALLKRGHSGGPEPTLAGDDHAAFVEQLRAGQFRRAKEAQAWIVRRTKRRLALSSVYTLLGKAGGVLKVPRKTHAKKDAAKTEAFKTELPARLDAGHR